MRAVVTGGRGFLGSFVVDRLSKEGIESLSCDIRDNGSAGTKKVDVTELADVLRTFNDFKPDVVIHLAALAGAAGKGGGAESIKDPYDFFRINFLGTLNVFEACRIAGISKVIHMSSFSPYGRTSGVIDENTPLNPNNPYGASKASAEHIATTYASLYGIQTCIFRAPLLCGETQKENNVLREIAYSALHGEAIVILGEGTHVREFIHPQDVADAYVRALNYMKANPVQVQPCEVFVLGNVPISMKELAKEIVKKSRNKKAKIEYKPSTKQVFDQYTDHRKAWRVLEWRPRISTSDIIDRVLSDIESHMDSSK